MIIFLYDFYSPAFHVSFHFIHFLNCWGHFYVISQPFISLLVLLVTTYTVLLIVNLPRDWLQYALLLIKVYHKLVLLPHFIPSKDLNTFIWIITSQAICYVLCIMLLLTQLLFTAVSFKLITHVSSFFPLLLAFILGHLLSFWRSPVVRTCL